MPLNPSSVWLQQSIATKWHTSWHKQWNEGGFYDQEGGRWESCFSPVVMRTFFVFHHFFSENAPIHNSSFCYFIWSTFNFLQPCRCVQGCRQIVFQSCTWEHQVFFIILIYCRYLTCVINFRGNCQKEVSDFINDGGKDTQAICTSISWETPEIKKRSLRAMIVLVLPGKKKGETENFLSNDTPHSFLAIPVSVTSPKTKLPPGNVNG